MQVDVVRSTESCIVRLRGNLTVEHAHELKQSILDALQGNERIVIELEGVTDVDLSFLQLLCAAHKTSMRLGKELTLFGDRSETFKLAVSDAGFPRILGCHEDPDRGCLWIGGLES